MKSIKNWIIVILTGALALSVVTGVVAQPRGGVNVELLVWQDTANPEQHYVTTRLAGGSWPPHGTVSVDLNRATPDGRWRYGKHTFELSVLATCSSGIAVSNPTQNPGLVEDCEHLLNLQDLLSVDQSFETANFLPAPLNWSPATPLASWTGVTVEGTPRRVTKLELPDLAMYGVLVSLSGSLTSFQGLTELHLNDNDLEGSVPSRLGQFANLTHLYLGGNRLTGCVPPSLRAVPNNDLASLELPDCGPPTDVVLDDRGNGVHVLSEGTYRLKGWIFEVPPLLPGLEVRAAYYEPEPESFIRFTLASANLYHGILDVVGGEPNRWAPDQVLDRIQESLWYEDTATER